MRLAMLTAALLTAGLALASDNDIKPPVPINGKKIDVPGKGEPEFTDEEAAAFAMHLKRLYSDAGREPPKTLKATLEALKIDAKKMRGGVVHVGNATDWVEYRLSPNYKLSAAYTQRAPVETAFRDVRIIKVTPVKPE